jgi:glycosyltransferase involved in cell wall biosynthesis
MPSPRRRILFVSHSASRNGASILLLHFVRWLREHTDHQLRIVCLGGGPLVAEYRAVASTTVLRGGASLLRALPWRWLARTWRAATTVAWRALLARGGYDVVYANTAATATHVATAARLRTPVLWHLHELPYAIGLLLGGTDQRAAFRPVTRCVAVSRSVAQALQQDCGVPEQRIDLVHGFVETSPAAPEAARAQRQRILSGCGWPPDAFVVGACGGLGWRKGADLFLQVARLCQQQPTTGAAMRFLWVGGDADGVEENQFKHDIAKLGLDDVCTHVPSTPDAIDYYSAMDAFALTSREDPYPLVMLEAGAQAVPTVCFEGSGGGPEFVEGGAGVAVPYLDVTAFARALTDVAASPQWREQLGRAAQRKVQREHAIDVQAPRLLASIERCMQPVAGDRVEHPRAKSA